MSRASIITFLHYTAWSTALFIPEYALFLFLLKHTHIHYVTISVATFILGVTAQYMLVRRYVFAHAGRPWQSGYALFALSSLAGAGIVAFLMIMLVEDFGMPKYIARVIAGAGAGYLVYLFNRYATFAAPPQSSAT
jgi:putative flippase GtrA